MTLQLIIGNKNYSSWSMRPWVLMTGLGLPFTEERLRFDFSPGSAFRQAVARVQALWAEALAACSGPFLFGAFGAADAMFAPVALRLQTCALPVDAHSADCMTRVAAAPGVAPWVADALAEQDFLDFEEPYRSGR